ncbi:MAG: alpha/beta hydrolase [Bdellovibrionales bacterium]
MLREYRIPPASGGPTGHAVVFLHGLGDSGQGGLLSIGGIWQAALPADTEFLCPDAPFAFDMAPAEDGGRQWFSMRDFSPMSMLTGAKSAAKHLNEYIDHVMASRGLKPRNLALVGFSQGAIMALYAGLRRPEQVAGIIGYSGVLVGWENLAREKKSSPPVLLVHGTADDVVSYAFFAPSVQGLQAAGIPVTEVTCPGAGHGIDDLGLAEGQKFLKKILI